MHRSVLQDEDYIRFSYLNTVEVLSLSRLEEAAKAGESRAATYEAKDGEGNVVERMVSWPNLTLEQILEFRKTPAARYNDTGKIPFTCIVDPWTLKEMDRHLGGWSADALMEAVTAQKRKLEEEHGPSLSRKDLADFREDAAKLLATLGKYGPARALKDYRKLHRDAEKVGPRLLAQAEQVHERLLGAAREQLVEAEALIGSGEAGAALKILRALERPLKGTALEERVAKLRAQAEGD